MGRLMSTAAVVEEGFDDPDGAGVEGCYPDSTDAGRVAKQAQGNQLGTPGGESGCQPLDDVASVVFGSLRSPPSSIRAALATDG